MPILTYVKALFVVACIAGVSESALGEVFDIPAGSLNTALDAYSKQTGIPLIVSADMVRGVKTNGVKGNLSPNDALLRILAGTGFTPYRDTAGIGISFDKR